MNASLERLAVIVVNFGSHVLLTEHLVRVSADLPGALIVVVDNFSDADERKAVISLAAREQWLLLPLNENTGFGFGSNRGADAALAHGCDRLLFLNPDAMIDHASVDAMLHALDSEPMAIVAPRIVNAAGRLWSAGMDIDLTTGDSRPWRVRDENPGIATLAWFTGACLLVGAELWTTVGGFDDDYFLYWEDVDFCVSAQKAGASLRLVEAATAVHLVGATQSQHRSASKSAVYYYYNIRNRSVFARKHLSLMDRRRWRRGSVRSAWRILQRGGRRQFLRPLAPLAAFWRGLRDSDYAART